MMDDEKDSHFEMPRLIGFNKCLRADIKASSIKALLGEK